MSNIPLYVESSLKHRLETRLPVAPIWWMICGSFAVFFFLFSWSCLCFFVDQKYTKKGCWSEKDELQSVCFLWKCVWMSWQQIHLFAVWDKRFIVIVTQKSTQRGSEYEEDVWDLWLFQGNLGWWFMLLHLPTLTVPPFFHCFSMLFL